MHTWHAHEREAVGSQAPRAHSSGEEGGKGHENQQLVWMHAAWNDMHGLAM